MTQVLVIGGSGSIGGALVERFAADGDDVLFTYLKAELSADQVAARCDSLPGKVAYTRLDTRDVSGISRVLDECGTDLRAIVFCAMSSVLRAMAEIRPRHWDWVHEVNTRAFAQIYANGLDVLAANRGTLVAISSIGARRCIPEYAAVGAAKAALEALVRYAAAEAGPRGVRVNGVCPGLLHSRSIEAFSPDTGDIILETVRRTPMGRLVTTGEVAEFVHWLSGPVNAMVTGQTISIDGGWELGVPWDPL